MIKNNVNMRLKRRIIKKNCATQRNFPATVISKNHSKALSSCVLAVVSRETTAENSTAIIFYRSQRWSKMFLNKKSVSGNITNKCSPPQISMFNKKKTKKSTLKIFFKIINLEKATSKHCNHWQLNNRKCSHFWTCTKYKGKNWRGIAAFL